MKKVALRFIRAASMITIPVWAVALGIVWIITGKDYFTRLMNWITDDGD